MDVHDVHSLGAQASLPAYGGFWLMEHLVAGKDACAPRNFQAASKI